MNFLFYKLYTIKQFSYLVIQNFGWSFSGHHTSKASCPYCKEKTTLANEGILEARRLTLYDYQKLLDRGWSRQERLLTLFFWKIVIDLNALMAFKISFGKFNDRILWKFDEISQSSEI